MVKASNIFSLPRFCVFVSQFVVSYEQILMCKMKAKQCSPNQEDGPQPLLQSRTTQGTPIHGEFTKGPRSQGCPGLPRRLDKAQLHSLPQTHSS